MRFVLNRQQSLLGMVGVLAFMLATAGCISTDVKRFVDQSPPEGAPLIRPSVSLRINVAAGGKVEEQVKEVSPSGELAFPFGTVKCDGMTLPELQDKLRAAYAQMILDPQVTVQFVLGPDMKSPWGTVLIGGQVARPGPVNMPQSRDLTVTRALQIAGGVTALGDQTAVLITRKSIDGKRKLRLKLDLDAIVKKGEPERDIVLHADDVVYVPEIFW